MKLRVVRIDSRTAGAAVALMASRAEAWPPEWEVRHRSGRYFVSLTYAGEVPQGAAYYSAAVRDQTYRVVETFSGWQFFAEGWRWHRSASPQLDLLQRRGSTAEARQVVWSPEGGVQVESEWRPLASVGCSRSLRPRRRLLPTGVPSLLWQVEGDHVALLRSPGRRAIANIDLDLVAPPGVFPMVVGPLVDMRALLVWWRDRRGYRVPDARRNPTGYAAVALPDKCREEP